MRLGVIGVVVDAANDVASSPWPAPKGSTLRAPASRCFATSLLARNLPVDSITTSAPSSSHGRSSGSSRGDRDPHTVDEIPPGTTTSGERAVDVSCLSRCASVARSAASLIPTHSMSAPDSTADRSAASDPSEAVDCETRRHGSSFRFSRLRGRSWSLIVRALPGRRRGVRAGTRNGEQET